jgi:hypothetical protein
MNEGPIPAFNGPLILLCLALVDDALDGRWGIDDLLNPAILGSREVVEIPIKPNW